MPDKEVGCNTPRSLRWPGEHDVLCERIAVDIGVGEMQSPCGCEVRWYHERLEVAQSLLDRAKERGELPEWNGDMLDYLKKRMSAPSEKTPQGYPVPCAGGLWDERPYGGEGDSIPVCSICNQPAGDHRDIVAVPSAIAATHECPNCGCKFSEAILSEREECGRCKEPISKDCKHPLCNHTNE